MSFSGTRAASWYFGAQAAAFVGWWTLLAFAPATRASFHPSGTPEADLLAFALPDALACALSAAAAVALARRSPWALPLAWSTAGAMGYATAYVLAWAVLLDGAWLAVLLMVPAAVFSALFALDSSEGRLRAFRSARARTRAGHLAATFGWIVAFWSFFLGLLPWGIAVVERRLGVAPYAFPVLLAAATFLAASALGLWSGITMAARGEGTPLPLDGTNRLVVAGPYRHVRNPMVLAGLAQGLAVVLAWGSWLGLVYVVLGGLTWHLVVRPAEERDLAERFGAAYEEYRRRVPLWVPRPRR